MGVEKIGFVSSDFVFSWLYMLVFGPGVGDWAGDRPKVVLLQEPERGLARLLLVGLKRWLERAPLQHRKRMLLQCLVRAPVR